MESYRFLLDLAIILLSTKLLGMFMKKLGLPQVVGALIAGLLIGPAIWSPMTNGAFIPVGPSQYLKVLAEIGVILIMFSAGLETDLKELKSCGLKAGPIAAAGVILPLGLGFLIAMPFFGVSEPHAVLSCIFIGVIITATSVSITVETLRELGKLKGRVGTVILSAAIIDDVIGIVILTVVTSLKDPGSGLPPWRIAVNIIVFFILAVGVGIALNLLFKWLSNKYPNKRRVPIFGLVVCFVYSYCAEKVFKIADITGAYLAGIMLSTMKNAGYVEKKIDTSAYMIFGPCFFAGIGINISFAGFKPQILAFAALFILAGIGGKIIGCGLTAKLSGFNVKDSLRIGVGMIARGEVALIVTQKGIESGLVPQTYLSAVICLVIVTSLTAPILLKLLFKSDQKLPLLLTDTVGPIPLPSASPNEETVDFCGADAIKGGEKAETGRQISDE